MVSSEFATSYGQSAFVDSSPVRAGESGSERSASDNSDAAAMEGSPPQKPSTKLICVGVMLLDPTLRSRRAVALILVLKAVLIACAVALALDP
jgi:hypothetical protein